MAGLVARRAYYQSHYQNHGTDENRGADEARDDEGSGRTARKIPLPIARTLDAEKRCEHALRDLQRCHLRWLLGRIWVFHGRGAFRATSLQCNQDMLPSC